MSREVNYPTFGNFVKQTIFRLGKSYTDVAEETGLSEFMIGAYANGYHAPIFPNNRKLVVLWE